MMDCKENKTQDIKDKEKEKVFCAEIVVEGAEKKPYYSILYYDLKDNSWHIGYSSYELSNVIRWKDEYLEIISDISAMRPLKKHTSMIHMFLNFMRRKK